MSHITIIARSPTPTILSRSYRDRSYSLSEMRTFKKMAMAIRNVDERKGHANATAAFIDAEFSDNSGYTVDALNSNNAWKKNRVNAICDKAAVIMEDRLVRTTSCHWVTCPHSLCACT